MKKTFLGLALAGSLLLAVAPAVTLAATTAPVNGTQSLQTPAQGVPNTFSDQVPPQSNMMYGSAFRGRMPNMMYRQNFGVSDNHYYGGLGIVFGAITMVLVWAFLLLGIFALVFWLKDQNHHRQQHHENHKTE